MYRPEGWYNPYWDEDAGGHKRPDEGYDEFEEGADAMLEAIWDMAKKSPTGQFVFDSRIQAMYPMKE